MIRPSKYLDLKTSVLNVSALILECLQNDKACLIGSLNHHIVNKLGREAAYSFLPSLSLLYLLGLIEYDDDSDMIYILEKKDVEM